MKKVTAYIQIENDWKPVEGFLLDSTNVIYIGEGSLKIVGVKLEGWKYVQNSSHIILGDVPVNINGELLVHSVVNRLMNTSIYDFFLSGWDRSEDVDFDFIKK